MSQGAAAAPAGRILVVDDDHDIRDALINILRLEGYEAAGATNGAEALDYLRGHHPPCLILLDLMMPIMNGWEFRNQQRQDATLATIPVIVISADRSIQQHQATFGAVGYITKPIEFDHLLDHIERFCPKTK